MITVYNKSGEITVQHEDWKLPAVQLAVQQHNENNADKLYIETRDLDTLVFKNGAFREKTDAEKVAEGTLTAKAKYDKELAECYANRRAAYVIESDPLKNEAEYDAMIAETEPDYSAWIECVADIKIRFPKPKLP